MRARIGNRRAPTRTTVLSQWATQPHISPTDTTPSFPPPSQDDIPQSTQHTLIYTFYYQRSLPFQRSPPQGDVKRLFLIPGCDLPLILNSCRPVILPTLLISHNGHRRSRRHARSMFGQCTLHLRLTERTLNGLLKGVRCTCYKSRTHRPESSDDFGIHPAHRTRLLEDPRRIRHRQLQTFRTTIEACTPVPPRVTQRLI